MERWSILIEKEYLKFSAAHFLIFPDGSAERLHGHNYQVTCAVSGPLSRFGLVLDFMEVKPVIRELCDQLDEHWLLPGEHHELAIEEDSDHWDVRYRERHYRAPKEDVIVLPINNTSAENLAAWVGGELKRRLVARFPDVPFEEVEVSVEETSGQRGIWTWRSEG
jgi:6-pyruvoyltetrahydropterin/6-carboxytetrahydropterin synthase